MPNLSIKNVPDEVVEKLRARAAANHRSLQGELMALVCHATEHGARRHERLGHGEQHSGWMTVEEIMAEHRANPLTPDQLRRAREATPAVDIIRRDRDSR